MSTQRFPTRSNGNDSFDSCTYRFISSSPADLPHEREYKLSIRQQPRQSKACFANDHDYRHAIDPPPILQLQWLNCSPDQTKQCLQSPFYFVVVNIASANNPASLLPNDQYLAGTTTSSLSRLRDLDDTDAGLFVFADLAVKKEGEYRLHFSLYEITGDLVQNRHTVLSAPFTAYTPKRFPGPLGPTALSCNLYHQGLKIRIRKEHRRQTVSAQATRKRGFQIIDYQQKGSASASSSKTNSSPKRSKHQRTFLPSYATHDVYFGRWQTTLPTKQQHIQSNMPSPPTSISSTSPPPEDLPHNHLPTPLSLYPSRSWGCRLPPLKTIMDGTQHVDPTHDRTLPPLVSDHRNPPRHSLL